MPCFTGGKRQGDFLPRLLLVFLVVFQLPAEVSQWVCNFRSSSCRPEFISFKPSNKFVSRRTEFPAFLRIWFVAGTSNSLGAL